MKTGERLAWLRHPGTGQLVELYCVPKGSRFYEPFRSVRLYDTRLLFSVQEVEPLLRRLRRLQATVRVSFDEGETRLVFLDDPDGNLIELAGWIPASKRKHRTPPLIQLVRPSRRRRT